MPAAYAKYDENPPVETRDVVEGVAVAYYLDEAGTIVGLEVLWIDDPKRV